jgi:hypothetical protein
VVVIDVYDLTSLPNGSFNTGNITKAGDDFFAGFNWEGKLASLPVGSFNTGKITTAGSDFFDGFNYDGKLIRGNESISIKNVTAGPINFYYWYGTSRSSERVAAGSSMTYNGQ